MPSPIVKPLKRDQHGKADQRLQDQKQRGLGDADLAGRNGTRAGALDAAVEIAIDDVVPGAAGAAHGEGADEEQGDVGKARAFGMGRDRGKR